MSFVMNAIAKMHAASMRVDTGFNMMVNNQRRLALTNAASQKAVSFGGVSNRQMARIYGADRALMLRNLQDSTTLKIAEQIEKNAKEKEKKLDFFV